MTPSTVERELDRFVALRLDELLHGAVGIVELVDHLRGVDLGAERVVDEVDGVGDVAVGFLEQLGDLGADERADRGDEQQERDHHAEQDRDRRSPAPPAAGGEPVDAGLDGEREEQRHEQQHEQRRQSVEHVAERERQDEARPEHGDGGNHPARHRPIGRPPIPRSAGGSTAPPCGRVPVESRHRRRRTAPTAAATAAATRRADHHRVIRWISSGTSGAYSGRRGSMGQW